MSYQIVFREKGVIVSFEGEINTQEIIDANSKLFGESRFDDLDYQIFDFTGVHKMEINDNQAKILATLDDNSTIWNSKMQVALVDTDPNHIKEAIKYIDLMENTPWKIRIFANLEEAEAWCRD